MRFSGKETAGLALAQEKTTGYPAPRRPKSGGRALTRFIQPV